jgi:hypothetical protein
VLTVGNAEYGCGVGSDGITYIQHFAKIGHLLRNLKCRYGDAIVVLVSDCLLRVDGTSILVNAAATHTALLCTVRLVTKSNRRSLFAVKIIRIRCFGAFSGQGRGFVTVEFL